MTRNLRSLIRSPLITWFGRLIGTLILLILLKTRINLTDSIQVLTNVNILWLILLLLLYLVIRLIWALQMSLGVAQLQINYSSIHLFKIILISNFYSLLVPGNMMAGSAVSLYKLSHNGKFVEAFALLAYFRLVNMLVFLLFGIIGMWFDPYLSFPHIRSLLGVVLVISAILFLLFSSSTFAKKAELILSPILHRIGGVSWLQMQLRSLWQTLAILQDLKLSVVVLAFGLSFVSHLLGIILYWSISQAIGIHLSVFLLIWIVTFLTLVQLVPISIAGIGIRELSVVFILGQHGVRDTLALAFSLILFTLTIISGFIGGLLEAWDLLTRTHDTIHTINSEPSP
jgi:uncharacterized protein (TIRG00374 family)